MKRTIVLATLALMLALGAKVMADDKPASMEDQYQALSAARTKADLAVHQTRAFFETANNAWRAAVSLTEAAEVSATQSYYHAVESEQRKPEDVRDPAFVDDCNAKRAELEQEWAKFNSTRPANDGAFN